MKKIICLIIAISTLVLYLASCNSSTVQNECEITYHYYLDAQKTEEVSEEQLLAGQVYYLFVNYKVTPQFTNAELDKQSASVAEYVSFEEASQ